MSYQKRKEIAEEFGYRAEGMHIVELGTDEEGNVMEETNQVESADFLVLIEDLMQPYPNPYDCVGSKERERMNDDFTEVERYKTMTLSGVTKWVDASKVFILDDEDFMEFTALVSADNNASALKMLREMIPEECGLSYEDKMRIREEEIRLLPTEIDFSALGKDIPEEEKQKVGTVKFFPADPKKGWEVARFAVRGNEVYVKGVLKRVKGGSFDIDVLNAHLNKEQLAFTKKAVMISYVRN